MSENIPNPIGEISDSDWAQTPERVKRLVRSLLGRIEQLEGGCQALEAEVATLREQVQRNSQNSSKPPSQDMGKGFKPKQQQKGNQKRRGGQLGHEGHEQKLYSLEQCDSVEDYYPGHCHECKARLTGSDPEPYRVQQVEIPPVVPVVREHRFHALTCECCGSATRAWDDGIIPDFSQEF